VNEEGGFTVKSVQIYQSRPKTPSKPLIEDYVSSENRGRQGKNLNKVGLKNDCPPTIPSKLGQTGGRRLRKKTKQSNRLNKCFSL